MEHYKNLNLESLFYINENGLVCQEEWKDIIGYENIYHSSSLGRIKSLSRYRRNGIGIGYIMPDKIRRQSLDSDGYLLVSLYIKGISEKLKCHRLVAQSFIPNPENKLEVNHKSKKGDKTDNRVENLEWNTRKENQKHAVENNLSNNKGEKHPLAKLTKKDVLEIRSSRLTNIQLSEIYGVGRTAINRIINRQRWASLL